MAKDSMTVRRGIYLYINGQEVKNDVKSIESEMRKLVNEQKRMTIGSNEYVMAGKKIGELKRILKEHSDQWRDINSQIEKTPAKVSKLSKISDVFNKYIGMATAFAASITGISLAFKKLSEENAKMDDVYADVMKTTGLTHKEVEELNESFKKMDTRTSREELNKLAADAGKLGITGKKDLLDFVDAGNQIRVALGEDLGEDAIKNIGKISDVYRASTKELDNLDLKGKMLAIGSSINELGQSSTANEAYLVEFAKRLGGVASQSGISIQNILGYASALDQSGQAVEMSATALQNFIMTLMAEPAKFAQLAGQDVQEFIKLLKTDANAAIIQVLTSLSQQGGFQALIPIFKEMGLDGARAVGVLSSLASNIDMVTEAQNVSNQAFSEGVSITNEYQTKNNNLQAQLDKLRKAFKEQALEVGAMLSPALLKSTSAMTYLIKAIIKCSAYFVAMKSIIIAITAATVAYITVKKLNVAWTQREAIVTKTTTVVMNTFRAAIYAVQLAYYTLTGQMSKARGAMVAFNTVCKANPWAALASAIALVGTALAVWIKNAEKAASESERLYEANKKAAEYSAQEKSRLTILLSIARNELASKEERLKAIKELNDLSPEYLGNLKLETINTNEARAAIDKYTESIERRAKKKALEENLNELYKRKNELNNMSRKADEDVNPYIPGDAKRAEALKRAYQKEMDEIDKDIKFFIQEINNNLEPITVPVDIELFSQQQNLETLKRMRDKLLSQIPPSHPSPLIPKEDTQSPQNIISNATSSKNPLTNGQFTENLELNSINKLINQTIKNIDSLQKKTEEMKKANTSNSGNNNPNLFGGEVDTSAIDLAYQKKLNALKKQLSEEKITQDEYNDEMYLAEVDYLRKKQALYISHSKEWEDIQGQIYDKELANAGKHNNRLIKQYENELRTAQLKLKESLHSRKISQEEYNEAILTAEIATLKKKQALQKKDSAEWTTLQMQIIDKENSLNNSRQSKAEQIYTQQRISLKKQMQDNQISEEDFQREMAVAELAYLREKQKNFKEHSKEWEAIEEQITDKTIAEANRRKNIDSNEGLNNLRKLPIEMQMEFAQELREKDIINEQQYQEEILRIQEKAAEQEKEIRKRKNEMILGGISSLANTAYSLMQSAQSREERRINQKYKARLDAAEGDSEATKAIEEEKEAELLKIKKEYADKQFALQVLSITAETAVAAMRAYSSALEIPIVGLYLAPVMAGIAVAAGLAQIASANEQRMQAQQLWSGGYTGSGNKYEPKRLIQTHGGEFVASKEAVDNPFIRPMFDIIDQAQRSGRVAALTSEDMSAAIGGKPISSGGYTSNPMPVNSPSVLYDSQYARILAENSRLFKRLSAQLDKPLEARTYVSGEHGVYEQMNRYNKLIKNASR